VIERFDRRRIATKKDTSVLSFERTKTAIGWPVRIACRRSFEEFAINSELFDGSVKTNSIDPYQSCNIFELLLAHILKYEIKLAACVLMHSVRHADSTWLGKSLQTRCNVHAISENVVAVDDDVTDIDANTELDPTILGGWNSCAQPCSAGFL
jgi:hypothetical protein